jgi:selenium metabolism protein YedF
MNELDCRGMNCPAPVLHVRDALEKEAFAAVTVRVDNEAARQNVSRFLEHQNFQVRSEVQGDEFQVFGTRGEGGDASEKVSPAAAVIADKAALKKIMVFVTSDKMGHGDDGLGDMLMFNFLKTLKEMGPELWRVTFVNSGVSFTAEGSEAVPVLRELAGMGVQISACGACLAFFHILDKIQVGEVTNMLEIVTSMKLADSVVTI